MSIIRKGWFCSHCNMLALVSDIEQIPNGQTTIWKSAATHQKVNSNDCPYCKSWLFENKIKDLT